MGEARRHGWSHVKSTALKVGIPVAVVAVVVVGVILLLAGGGGAGQKQPPREDTFREVRPVSERQIRAIPLASEPIQVTNRIGPPRRTEEARRGSDIPQRQYFYYPVKGGERSQLWELTFENERLAGFARCSIAVVVERGGGACSEPPSR